MYWLVNLVNSNDEIEKEGKTHQNCSKSCQKEAYNCYNPPNTDKKTVNNVYCSSERKKVDLR